MNFTFSEGTVKEHLHRIFRKLGVESDRSGGSQLTPWKRHRNSFGPLVCFRVRRPLLDDDVAHATTIQRGGKAPAFRASFVSVTYESYDLPAYRPVWFLQRPHAQRSRLGQQMFWLAACSWPVLR